jgi:CcdB protein.
MARQFDVCRMRNGALVVVIQSDLLDEMRTRVVVPLLPRDMLPPIGRLTPEVIANGVAYLAAPQLMATLTLDELGAPVASAAEHRDALIRACDLLLGGV